MILKIHGTVDRENSAHDSYVVTEDHYIDYLAHSDILNRLPVTLCEQLKTSHYLFLGYSLSDWNLRVFLHRIWRSRKLTYQAWAILRHPSPLEAQSWKNRGVTFFNVQLEDYIGVLARFIDRQEDATREP